MFTLPPHVFSPQYFFYFLFPTPPTPIEPYSLPTPTVVETNSLQSDPFNQEEKIVLTRQDLMLEGYQQTKKPWTEAEDKLLLKLCRNQDLRFEQIASMIKGRNAKMCYSRYRRLSYETRVGWSKSEDQKLLALVEQHGDDDWKNIAIFFKGRTYKQICYHYVNYLKADITKAEWTLEEDLQLIRLINEYGKNWGLIEESLLGRSRPQIKNRFFGKITRLNSKKLQKMKTAGNA